MYLDAAPYLPVSPAMTRAVLDRARRDVEAARPLPLAMDWRSIVFGELFYCQGKLGGCDVSLGRMSRGSGRAVKLYMKGPWRQGTVM